MPASSAAPAASSWRRCHEERRRRGGAWTGSSPAVARSPPTRSPCRRVHEQQVLVAAGPSREPGGENGADRVELSSGEWMK